MTQPNAKLVEVARAIAEEHGDERFDEPGSERLRSWYLDFARSAIRALMEPSEDMLEAGEDAMIYSADDFVRNQSDTVYRAMLAKVIEE